MQRGGETGASVTPGKQNTRVRVDGANVQHYDGANVQPNSTKKTNKAAELDSSARI